MKKLLLFSALLTFYCCKKNEVKTITKDENKYEISLKKFEKIKSLEGDWYLFDKPKMLQYGSLDKPFIKYQITSAGNAVVEKLFFNQEREMTTVYYMNIDELAITHYCSLGNQPYFVANSDDNISNISFNFIKASNMISKNDAHIHTHSLEIISDKEIVGHWGTWKDQKPFGIDRAFHVYRK